MIISPRITLAARPDYSALSRQSGNAFIFFVKLFATVAAALRNLRPLAFRLMLGALAPVAVLQAQNYANPYTFSTLAGSGTSGSSDGTGTAAQFLGAFGVAVDSAGNVFVADTGNDTIRKITPAGVVTTFAGTAGSAGSTDATGSSARFSSPRGVAVNASGTVFVADTGNHTIRKITSAGVVTTLAGTAGTHGQADGIGGAAMFESPYAITVDNAGNVYVTDLTNNNVRKITSTGNVTTLAGSTAGSSGSSGSVDGAGTAARFNQPYGIAVDSVGNLFVADTQNDTIRKITAAGTVSTYSGSALSAGSADGTLSAARFNLPVSVAVDASGNVFVSDLNNHTLREITAAGQVETLGGSPGQPGVVDATGRIARLYSPNGLAVDSSENLYFAESISQLIRKAKPAAVALGASNQLIGWGDGQHYQLGLANTSGSNVPVGVTGLEGYKISAVASSANHVLALVSDGSLLAWGLNSTGQLGNNSNNTSSDPVVVDMSGVLAGKVVKAIAVNGLTSYALTTEGKVYAWGNGSHGELGNNSTSGSLVPVAVSTSGVLTGKTISAIAAGDGCAFALSSDGRVFSWGDNSSDQLGNGGVGANSPVPVAVTTSGVLSGKTVTAIAAGGSGSVSVYALASDGHVYSWGGNGSAGRLGDNTTNLASAPVAVYTAGYLSGKTIVAIAAGQANGYALSSTGEAFSWGANDAGQLGCGTIGGVTIGTGSQVPVPVLPSGVLAGKTLNAIGAGQINAYVLASDGTLYSWGASGGTGVPVAVDESGVLAGVQITGLQSGASANTYFVLASPLPLAFTTQPVSQTVTVGGSVTFTAAATGSPTPTYQWQKGGVNIAGATGATYSIASVVSADAGNYAVVATNSGGSLTSSAATLTVNVPPVITTQPTSATVTAGNTVSFTVAASGNPAPTYQWKKGGVAIPGATGATYSIASVVAGDAGSYTAVATNSAGTATSSAAILTVSAPTVPAITTQPLSSAVFAGGSVTLVGAASGAPSPTYQWQKNGINVPGATGSSLTLSNIQVSDAGSYALVATNSAGSITSNFAQLVVLVTQANAITYALPIYPTGVTPGGNVGLDFVLTNLGTRNWGTNHYLSIRDSHGTFVAFASLIGVHSGEDKRVHLSFTAPTVPGSYTYTVQALENGVEFFSTQTTFVLNVLAPQANSITYNSTSFPATANPGSALIFNYNVTNTGTKTWGVNHFLSLRTQAGVYAQFSSLNGVAPGQSKTVNLAVTAPSTPGIYSYYVQALESGVEFFANQANLTLTVVAPRPNAAVYTQTRSQDNVVPGATVNLRYSLSNAGTSAWGASHYVSIRDGNGTFLSFVPLDGVVPGGTLTVNFSFVAPTTPGVYPYYVQALQDGVEFFDRQDLFTLNVLATPIGNAATYNATNFPATAARSTSVTFTTNLTNRGTKSWGANHYLSLRDADNAFLGFLPLAGIATGASQTFTFNFTAPSSPGVYTYHLQALESGIEFFDMSDDLVLIVP